MKVMHGDHRQWDPGVESTASTVGVYDGVHKGHVAVLERLRTIGDGKPIGVVTFDQHPATLLAPRRVPPLLTSTDQKLEALEQNGVDVVGILTFDESIASMSADQFVRDVLRGAMAATHVAVGRDFRFGYQRRGDIAVLESMGTTEDFEVIGLDLAAAEGEPVSSSRIRSLIANGDVAGAASLLGRPFALRGQVVPGDGRGRTIGIPTANVDAPSEMAQPGRGVYAVWVTIDGERRRGVANVGVRPTFGGKDDVVVEVHVLDFEKDLYGRVIEVAFVDRIRNEKRFHGIVDLVDQIGLDIATARSMLDQSIAE